MEPVNPISGPKPKRYRAPKLRPGQLLAYFGKAPKDDPAVTIAWGGDGATKRDANLLSMLLSGERFERVFGSDIAGNGGEKWRTAPTFLELLAAHGYDLSTLKFSIERVKGGSGASGAPGDAVDEARRDT